MKFYDPYPPTPSPTKKTMKEEQKKNTLIIYSRKQPDVTQVEVADAGVYWRIEIPTYDNPTLTVDDIL